MVQLDSCNSILQAPVFIHLPRVSGQRPHFLWSVWFEKIKLSLFQRFPEPPRLGTAVAVEQTKGNSELFFSFFLPLHCTEQGGVQEIDALTLKKESPLWRGSARSRLAGWVIYAGSCARSNPWQPRDWPGPGCKEQRVQCWQPRPSSDSSVGEL